MSTPFQVERSETLQPSNGSTGLHAEFASMMNIPQLAQTDRPQVVSSDGTQLVIPPIGQTSSDQTVATVPNTTKPVDNTGAPTTDSNAAATQTASADTSAGSSGDSDPAIPMWMRLAPTGMVTQKVIDEYAASLGKQTASSDGTGSGSGTAPADGTTPDGTDANGGAVVA